MGTLDGQAVFGYATSFTPAFDPTAAQINAFFGVDGVQALHGGQRGFVVLVSGVLFDLTPNAAIARETILLGYRDGIARTLVDNFGTTYLDVVFDGAYQRWEQGVKPAYLGPAAVGGWAIAYKAVFRGLGG
ncbi:hypothetical protein [Paludisphaera soli]|uniref:hypothetical protein n=1 Tax=Paludisphaera soli TaxID=2712865 RepID=UPI0013EA334A|nr:hypothetical protein [Paludisphaera soli]